MKSRFSRALALVVFTLLLATPSFAAPKQQNRDGLVQKIVKVLKAIKKPFVPTVNDDIVWPKP